MRRREFIAGLGGAVAWPLAARGQPAERVRRIGVLVPYDENDPEAKADLSAFTQRLVELGWVDGRNLRVDVRWAAGSVDRARMYAKELVNLQPDVIVANSTPQTAALQRETRTIPIVFLVVSDPVGSGFVAGLPRPDGNITGFINYQASMGGSGWNCSRRSRPASSGSQPCSILTRLSHRITCPLSRQALDRSKLSRSQRPFIAMMKSKRP
jgi:putative tryptophan/tyrosine transport system substrate-binding protein